MSDKNFVDFAPGFLYPSKRKIDEALGKFPWTTLQSKRMVRMSSLFDEEEAVLDKIQQEHIDDIDDEGVFSSKDGQGKSLWKPLPKPMDQESWLARTAEAGQTVEDYEAITCLRSGKFIKSGMKDDSIIYLLPIVSSLASESSQWPSAAPDLTLLSQWVAAFYNRMVIILDPANISVNSSPTKGKAVLFRTDRFQTALKGRVSETVPGRFQVQVDDLLTQILTIKDERTHTYTPASNREELLSLVQQQQQKADGARRETSIDLTQSPPPPPPLADIDETTTTTAEKKRVIHHAYAVVGVTMADLYMHHGDLFIAGLANSRSHVAVLSFARYHPHLRMHFQIWDNYGYASKASDYSYFEEGKPTPTVSVEPPSMKNNSVSKTEYLRRAGKLVIHELGHIYSMDHCIYYDCLMNGTGHLVEDFAAPAHVCVVCLRKLQFRLGFGVSTRYKRLLNFFKKVGMKDEGLWTSKIIRSLKPSVKTDEEL